jgi:serine/threonine-protein kinase RsbW
MNVADQGDSRRRILGRVEQDEFVGRAAELCRVTSHPGGRVARGLLLLLAPSAGVSELLRQAYDELFHQRARTIPIYFALPGEETTSVSTAIEFLNVFLTQYLAFRRNDYSLCDASLTLNDLLELAPTTDYGWLAQLIEGYNRERFGNDDRALIRFCLAAPQKVPVANGRVFLMLDAVPLPEPAAEEPSVGSEIIRMLSRSRLPYAIAGLRRQLLDAVCALHCDFETIDIIRLDKLSDEDGRALLERLAQRQQVAVSEETRDLLVQQFDASPFFMTGFMRAASERNISLTSYLAAEQLYVEELMGGQLGRYFSALLETVAFEPATRRALVRILYESALTDGSKSSFETWKNQLRLAGDELERILRVLHVEEFINWNGSTIDTGRGSQVWKDYLKTRFRLEVNGEPRALVVAETIAAALKRAPHTMARHYRRTAAIGLRELLARFDCQRVPAILLDCERFNNTYKGAEPEEIAAGLDADTDLIRLPQVIHVASCAAFSAELQTLADEERCVVAHSFQDGTYNDASEVVWLAAQIDSKLEVAADLAKVWCDLLELVAHESHFGRTRIWLIAAAGFTTEACKVLADAGAYGASHLQFELLTARLNEGVGPNQEIAAANEFEMTVPMGDDNEMIVAHAVEQLARRLKFQPEAINQIKHAVVEACINASEHSLSPERRIHQRFHVADDKLVITISSRGIVPASFAADNGEQTAEGETTATRRGWGLNMIRTLMDEVEFERVDDGTSLRMTKYLRH